jgi:hypothetical protein
MALNVGQLVTQMLMAAAEPLKAGGQKVLVYAKSEFLKIAQTIALIEEEALTGTLTKDEAALLLDMQKNASRAVLAGVEGMSLLAVEQAINAALSAIKAIVNGTLPFKLIG